MHRVLVFDARAPDPNDAAKLRFLGSFGGEEGKGDGDEGDGGGGIVHAPLSQPHGVAAHGEYVFVAEQGAHRISVFRDTASREARATSPTLAEGVVAGVSYEFVRTIGGKGIAPGKLRRPRGLAIVSARGESGSSTSTTTLEDVGVVAGCDGSGLRGAFLAVAEAKRVQLLSLKGEPLQVLTGAAWWSGRHSAGGLWGICATPWELLVTDGGPRVHVLEITGREGGRGEHAQLMRMLGEAEAAREAAAAAEVERAAAQREAEEAAARAAKDVASRAAAEAAREAEQAAAHEAEERRQLKREAKMRRAEAAKALRLAEEEARAKEAEELAAAKAARMDREIENARQEIARAKEERRRREESSMEREAMRRRADRLRQIRAQAEGELGGGFLHTFRSSQSQTRYSRPPPPSPSLPSPPRPSPFPPLRPPPPLPSPSNAPSQSSLTKRQRRGESTSRQRRAGSAGQTWRGPA